MRDEEPEPALQIVCYIEYLPDPIWRKRCLRFGGGVYDVVGRVWDNESKDNKIKDFESFDIMFFIYSNKQNALVLG